MENPQHFILITFPDDSSVKFDFNATGIHVLQMLVAADWMQIMARSDLLKQQEMRQVQVPKDPMKILRPND